MAMDLPAWIQAASAAPLHLTYQQVYLRHHHHPFHMLENQGPGARGHSPVGVFFGLGA